MTYDLEQAVRQRRSVRTYDENRPLSLSDRAELREMLAGLQNPFGVPVRFRMLDHAGAERDYDLDCKGVILGTELYLAAVVGPAETLRLEGYSFTVEQAVLHAAGHGVGTCWVAGTMNRPEFERAAALEPGETLGAILALGYPADKPSLRERAMRKAIRADSRLSWEELFFDGDFSTPLRPEAAGSFAKALELVRLAPSAVNKQPWRVLRRGKKFHFLENRTMSRDPDSDVQRIDLGIAMAHFDLAVREAGLTGRWTAEPGETLPPLPDKWVYTAAWTEDE